jgi:uncharacterized membrane protein YjjP (DUF1212 family)
MRPASGTIDPAAMLPRVLRLLLTNGQTTERALTTVEQLGRTFDTQVTLIPGWDCTWFRTGPTGTWEPIPATPAGIEMHKVAATMRLAESLFTGQTSPDAAASALTQIEALPPVALPRFAIMAACGAMALAVVFGATQPVPILLIGLAALLGGIVRRLLAGVTRNLFIQPFAAATIAGLIGAISLRGWAGPPTSLVALGPGMVLVPGPHLLNGALDLIRGRLPIGFARLAYATLILTILSTGLLLGLALGGGALPASEASRTVPLTLDVAAAGIAVLAYGTFFSMTWRSLPVSVLTGMAAHAIHWLLLNTAHGTLWLSAFVSCLFVGIVMSLYAERAHLPYAGCAFASVVALIPGSYIFRMADSLFAATSQRLDAAVPLLADAAQDGTTAFATFIAMAGGLLLPRLVLGPKTGRR